MSNGPAPFTFQLDDIVARKILANVKRYAKSPRAAITAITFTVDRLVRETFAKQVDPWGTPWVPLKQSTLRQRKYKKIKSLAKLVATKELFRSFDRGVDSDNDGHFTLGTPTRPVLPHLFGNPMNTWGGVPAPIPARPMLPIRPNGNVEISDYWRTRIMAEVIKTLPEGFLK